jgi:hypothetical protein
LKLSILTAALGCAAALAIAPTAAEAQQVPIPGTAAQVPGPALPFRFDTIPS